MAKYWTSKEADVYFWIPSWENHFAGETIVTFNTGNSHENDTIWDFESPYTEGPLVNYELYKGPSIREIGLFESVSQQRYLR